jgi:hypothetical protein
VQLLDSLCALGVHFRESTTLLFVLHPCGIPIVMQTYGLPIVARQLGQVLML